MEEIYDLPGYSGTAEEEIRCSVIIPNNAIATEAGACVEHPALEPRRGSRIFLRSGASGAPGDLLDAQRRASSARQRAYIKESGVHKHQTLGETFNFAHET